MLLCKYIFIYKIMKELEKVKYGILFSYYGKLLNKNQQEILNLYLFEDLGFSEIANNYNTSRQAIRQVIINSKLRLDKYEEDLKIVERIRNFSHELENIIKNENLDYNIKEKLKEIILNIEEF